MLMRKLPKIVLMIEPLGEYVQGILRGIVKYANAYGPWTFYRAPGKHEGFLPQLEHRQADGIIARIPKTASSIRKLPSNVPVIIIGYREIIPQLPQLLGDAQAIAKIAAEYFLNKGFKNFGFCGFDEMHWSRERAMFFRQYFENKGYTFSLYKNLQSSKRKNWALEQQDLAKWLKSLPWPNAILACNDDRGQHIINACKLAGIKVPEEIAVLGVDNDEFVCNLTRPPLSSIMLGTEKAGFEAAQLLSKMMKQNKIINESIMVQPTHVMTRQSTDIVAADDQDVSAAIAYIHNNAHREISVDQVAHAAAISRRTLERKFRKYLNNRSIYDEIKRTRVNRIITMLMETDLSITQIGMALDFKDLTHISRQFREETGLPPLLYRKKFKAVIPGELRT
jgi:LacI family transcriptional regulator